MRAALLCGEQHAHLITGDTPMLTSKAKFSANAATTFGLATTVAALWMAAVPFAGAVADVQISAARAQAIQQCNRLAAPYPPHHWGNTATFLYRTCRALH